MLREGHPPASCKGASGARVAKTATFRIWVRGCKEPVSVPVVVYKNVAEKTDPKPQTRVEQSGNVV